MYCVTATIIHHTKDQHCCSVDLRKDIPTFYLDEKVQGIVDEKHAEEIARQIILPVDLDYDSVTVNVHVSKV